MTVVLTSSDPLEFHYSATLHRAGRFDQNLEESISTSLGRRIQFEAQEAGMHFAVSASYKDSSHLRTWMGQPIINMS